MHYVARALVFLASLQMVLLAGLTFVDVVGRYLFNRPINGAQEIASILLGLTIFTALPAITMRENHITVDILRSLFRGRVDHLRRVLVVLATGGAFATLAYVLYRQAGKLAFMEMRTPHLHLRQDLIVYGLFALMVLTVILLVRPFYRALLNKKGVDPR